MKIKLRKIILLKNQDLTRYTLLLIKKEKSSIFQCKKMESQMRPFKKSQMNSTSSNPSETHSTARFNTSSIKPKKPTLKIAVGTATLKLPWTLKKRKPLSLSNLLHQEQKGKYFRTMPLLLRPLQHPLLQRRKYILISLLHKYIPIFP